MFEKSKHTCHNIIARTFFFNKFKQLITYKTINIIYGKSPVRKLGPDGRLGGEYALGGQPPWRNDPNQRFDRIFQKF